MHDLIEREHPALSVSLSSEVDPEIREFERTCTTARGAAWGSACARA